jgi:chitinase
VTVTLFSLGLGAVFFCCGGNIKSNTNTQSVQKSTNLWVTAYYTAWGSCGISPHEIDYSAVTHVVHQGIEPNSSYTGVTSDGIPMNNWKLPEPAPGWSGQAYFERGIGTGCDDRPVQANLIGLAHQQGVKVILGLGGSYGNGENFTRIASDPSKLSAYLFSILRYARTRGYDGVDVDWEFVWSHERNAFVSLLKGLHDSLATWNPRGLLTIAIPGWTNAGYGYDYAAMNLYCDQINMMNYDYTGSWNTYTGYNSPLYRPMLYTYDGGVVDEGTNDVLTQGVTRSKLGLGIPFYGYIVPTNHAPGEVRKGYPQQISYAQVLPLISSASSHWDSTARVPWLGSITQDFVTFENDASVALKVNYASESGLGGVMVFELWRGVVPTNSPGQRQPLMAAVKREVESIRRK